MIIELFGLPAVGKSTFAKHLVDSSGALYVNVNGLWKVLILNMLFFVAHPISFLGNFYFLCKYASSLKIFRLNFLNAFLYRNAKWQKAKLLKSNVIILDEGQHQNILSFPSVGLHPHDIKTFSSFFLQPDKLIVLNCEESLRQGRLKKKGYKGREVIGEKELQTWEGSAIENYQKFLGVLSQLKVDYEIKQIV